jgi:choline dehydrogenase-like flavoprotein
MLRDASSIEFDSPLDCDVCIVGSGPAGITLGIELSVKPLRVIIIAGGDLRPSASARALNEGTSDGRPYYSLDGCRVRAFGGTTHTWGGWSRSLEESDFKERDWIPHSGWPFTLHDLEFEFERAQHHLGISPVPNDPKSYTRPGGPPLRGLSSHSSLDEILFQVAPVRFSERHRAALHSADNVDVLLNAHATKVVMAENGQRATGVECAILGRARFQIRANTVVLAAGGIENARLLLDSPGQGVEGIGNARGLVGRFFGEHLHVPIGEMRISDSSVAAFFQPHFANKHRVRGGLSLGSAVRKERRLLGSAITLHNADDPHDLLSPSQWHGGYDSMMILVRAALRGTLADSAQYHLLRMLRHLDEAAVLGFAKVRKPPARRLLLGLRAEQAPNSESRVCLSHETDQFGGRKAHVRWLVSDDDLASISETQRVVYEALRSEEIKMFPRDGINGWLARLRPGAHHMGTTRMHVDPAHGVVNARGIVHGTENLYVTGSSVFPTGGCVPPTLTIIALAVRVARDIATDSSPRESNLSRKRETLSESTTLPPS